MIFQNITIYFCQIWQICLSWKTRMSSDDNWSVSNFLTNMISRWTTKTSLHFLWWKKSSNFATSAFSASDTFSKRRFSFSLPFLLQKCYSVIELKMHVCCWFSLVFLVLLCTVQSSSRKHCICRNLCIHSIHKKRVKSVSSSNGTVEK